jgi:hypothetical protein
MNDAELIKRIQELEKDPFIPLARELYASGMTEAQLQQFMKKNRDQFGDPAAIHLQNTLRDFARGLKK